MPRGAPITAGLRRKLTAGLRKRALMLRYYRAHAGAGWRDALMADYATKQRRGKWATWRKNPRTYDLKGWDDGSRPYKSLASKRRSRAGKNYMARILSFA